MRLSNGVSGRPLLVFATIGYTHEDYYRVYEKYYYAGNNTGLHFRYLWLKEEIEEADDECDIQEYIMYNPNPFRIDYNDSWTDLLGQKQYKGWTSSDDCKVVNHQNLWIAPSDSGQWVNLNLNVGDYDVAHTFKIAQGQDARYYTSERGSGTPGADHCSDWPAW